MITSSLSKTTFVHAQSHSECNSGGGRLVIEDQPSIPDGTVFRSALSGCHIIIRNSATTKSIKFEALDSVNITIENLDCSGIADDESSCVRFLGDLTNVGNVSISNVVISPATTLNLQTVSVAVLMFSGKITNVNDTFLIENVGMRNVAVRNTGYNANLYAILMQAQAEEVSALDPSNAIFYDETSSSNSQLMKQRLPFPKMIIRNIFLIDVEKVETDERLKVFAVNMNDVFRFSSVVFENIVVRVDGRIFAGGGTLTAGAIHVKSVHGSGDYVIRNRRQVFLDNNNNNNNNDDSNFLALLFKNISFSSGSIYASETVYVYSVDFSTETQIFGFKDVIVTNLQISGMQGGIESVGKGAEILIFSARNVAGLANQAATSTALTETNNEDLFARIISRFIFSDFVFALEPPTLAGDAGVHVKLPAGRELRFSVLTFEQSIRHFTSVIVDDLTIDNIRTLTAEVDFSLFDFDEDPQFVRQVAPQEGPAAIALSAATNNNNNNNQPAELKIPTSSFIMSNIKITNLNFTGGPNEIRTTTRQLFIYKNIFVGITGYEKIIFTNITVDTIDIVADGDDQDVNILFSLIYFKSAANVIIGGRSVYDGSNNNNNNGINHKSISSVGSLEISNINFNRVKRDANQGDCQYILVRLPEPATGDAIMNFENILFDNIHAFDVDAGSNIEALESRVVVIQVWKDIIGVDYKENELFYAGTSLFQVSNISIINAVVTGGGTTANNQLRVDLFSSVAGIHGFCKFRFENFRMENIVASSSVRMQIRFLQIGNGLSFPASPNTASTTDFLPMLPAKSSVLVKNFSCFNMNVRKVATTQYSNILGFVAHNAMLRNFDEIVVQDFDFRNIRIDDNADEGPITTGDTRVDLVRLSKNSGSPDTNIGSGRPGSLFSVSNIALLRFHLMGRLPESYGNLFSCEGRGVSNFEYIVLSNLTRKNTFINSTQDEAKVHALALNAPMSALHSFTINNIHDENITVMSKSVFLELIWIHELLSAGQKFSISDISMDYAVCSISVNNNNNNEDCISRLVMMYDLNPGQISALSPTTSAEFSATNFRVSNLTADSPDIIDFDLQLMYFNEKQLLNFTDVRFENFLIDGVSINKPTTSNPLISISALLWASTVAALEAPTTSLRFSSAVFVVRNMLVTNVYNDHAPGAGTTTPSASISSTVRAPKISGFTRITFENIEFTNSFIKHTLVMISNLEDAKKTSHQFLALYLQSITGPTDAEILNHPADIDAPVLTIRNVAVSGITLIWNHPSTSEVTALRLANGVLLQQLTQITIDNISLVDSSVAKTNSVNEPLTLPRVSTVDFSTSDGITNLVQGVAIPWMVAAPSAANEFNPRGAALAITNLVLARVTLDQQGTELFVESEGMRAMNLNLEAGKVERFTTMKFENFKINAVEFKTAAATTGTNYGGGTSWVFNMYAAGPIRPPSTSRPEPEKDQADGQISSLSFNNFEITDTTAAKNYISSKMSTNSKLVNVYIGDIELGTNSVIQYVRSLSFTNLLIRNCTVAQLMPTGPGATTPHQASYTELAHVKIERADLTAVPMTDMNLIRVENLLISSCSVISDASEPASTSADIYSFTLQNDYAFTAADYTADDAASSLISPPSVIFNNISIVNSEFAAANVLASGVLIRREDGFFSGFLEVSFTSITIDNNTITLDPTGKLRSFEFAHQGFHGATIEYEVKSPLAASLGGTNNKQYLKGITSFIVSDFSIRNNLIKVRPQTLGGSVDIVNFQNRNTIEGYETTRFENLIISRFTVEYHTLIFNVQQPVDIANVLSFGDILGVNSPTSSPTAGITSSLTISQLEISSLSIFMDYNDATSPRRGLGALHISNFNSDNAAINEFAPCTVQHLIIDTINAGAGRYFYGIDIQNAVLGNEKGFRLSSTSGALLPSDRVLLLSHWRVHHCKTLVSGLSAAVANLRGDDASQLQNYASITAEYFSLVDIQCKSDPLSSNIDTLGVTAHQFRLHAEGQIIGFDPEPSPTSSPSSLSFFTLRHFMIRDMRLISTVTANTVRTNNDNGLGSCKSLSSSNFYYDEIDDPIRGFASVTFENLTIDTMKVAMQTGSFLVNNIFFMDNTEMIQASAHRSHDPRSVFLKISDTTVRSFTVLTDTSRLNGDHVFLSSVRFGVTDQFKDTANFYFSGFYSIIITNVLIEDISIVLSYPPQVWPGLTFHLNGVVLASSQSAIYGPGSSNVGTTSACSEIVDETIGKHPISFEVSNVAARNIHMSKPDQGGYSGVSTSGHIKGVHHVLFSNFSLQNYFFRSYKGNGIAPVVDRLTVREGCTGKNPIPFFSNNNNDNNNNRYIRSTYIIRDISIKDSAAYSLGGDHMILAGCRIWGDINSFDDFLIFNIVHDNVSAVNGHDFNPSAITSVDTRLNSVQGTNSSHSIFSMLNLQVINSRLSQDRGKRNMQGFIGNLQTQVTGIMSITSFRKVSFDNLLVENCSVDYADDPDSVAAIQNIYRPFRRIIGSSSPLFDESTNNNNPRPQHPPSVLSFTNMRVVNLGTDLQEGARAGSFIVGNVESTKESEFSEFGMIIFDHLELKNIKVKPISTDINIRNIHTGAAFVGSSELVPPSSLDDPSSSSSSSSSSNYYFSQDNFNLYKKYGTLLLVKNLIIDQIEATSPEDIFVVGFDHQKIPGRSGDNNYLVDFQSIVMENFVLDSVSATASPEADQSITSTRIVKISLCAIDKPVEILAKTILDPNNNDDKFFETTFKVNNFRMENVIVATGTTESAAVSGFELLPNTNSAVANFASVVISDIRMSSIQLLNVATSKTIRLQTVTLGTGTGSFVMRRQSTAGGDNGAHWTLYPRFSITKISSENILLAPNASSSLSSAKLSSTIINADVNLDIINYNIIEFKDISAKNIVVKQFDLLLNSSSNNNNNHQQLFDDPVGNNVRPLGTILITNLALNPHSHSSIPSAGVTSSDLYQPNRFEISSLSLSEVYVFGASSLQVNGFMHRRYNALINGFQKIVVDSITMQDFKLVPFGNVRIANSLSGAAVAYRSEETRWKGGANEITLSNFITTNIDIKQNNATASQIIKTLEIESTNPEITSLQRYDTVTVRDFVMENLQLASIQSSSEISVDGVDVLMLLTAKSDLIIKNLRAEGIYIATNQDSSLRLLHIAKIGEFPDAAIKSLHFKNNTFSRSSAGSSAKAAMLSTSFDESLKNVTISDSKFELPKLPASSSSFGIAFEIVHGNSIVPSSATAPTPQVLISNNEIIDASILTSDESRKAKTLATTTSLCSPATCSLLKFDDSAFASGTFTLSQNTIEPIISMVFASEHAFERNSAVLKIRMNTIKEDSTGLVSASKLLTFSSSSSSSRLDLNGTVVTIECNVFPRPFENQFLGLSSVASNVEIRRDCQPTPTHSSIRTTTLDPEPTPTFFNVTNTTSKSISQKETHSGSLPTRSLSIQIPKPKLVGDAVSQTVKSLGMALTALSGGANGMNSRKVIAISSLADCGKIEITDEDIPPVEPDSNPLFIKFGSRRFDTYRGSIVGAIAFLAAWFALMCFLGWLRAIIERSSVKRALRKIGVPGTLCVPGFSLLPVAVNSASAIAKRYYPEEKLDMFMIVFAFITAAVIPIIILIWIAREVRAHEVLKPSNDISDDDIDEFLARQEKKKNHKEPTKADQKKKNPKKIRKLLDDGSEVPTWKYWFDWLSEPKRNFKRSKFKDAYGPIFDGFTSPFFILFSYCLVIAAEITEGTTSLCAKGDFECCNMGLKMILAVSVLDVVNIIFFTITTRAFVFLVRSDAVCVTICALIGLANACIIRVQFDSGEDYTDTLVTLTETAFYIALIGGGLALINEIVGAGFEVRTVLRQRNKPKEIQEFEELLMSHDVIQKYNSRREKKEKEKKKSFSGEKDKNKSSDDSKDKTKKTNAQLQQIVADAARLDDQELENMLSSPPRRKHGSRDDRNLSSRGRNTTTSRTRRDDVNDDIRTQLAPKTKESHNMKYAVEDTNTGRRASSRTPRSKPQATSATKREHERKARKVAAENSDISIVDTQNKKENTTSKKHESSSRTRSATTKKK